MRFSLLIWQDSSRQGQVMYCAYVGMLQLVMCGSIILHCVAGCTDHEEPTSFRYQLSPVVSVFHNPVLLFKLVCIVCLPTAMLVPADIKRELPSVQEGLKSDSADLETVRKSLSSHSSLKSLPISPKSQDAHEHRVKLGRNALMQQQKA